VYEESNIKKIIEKLQKMKGSASSSEKGVKIEEVILKLMALKNKKKIRKLDKTEDSLDDIKKEMKLAISQIKMARFYELVDQIDDEDSVEELDGMIDDLNAIKE
jgi:hypothetical protein